MYVVTLKNGNKTTTIHGIKEKLKSGSVVKGINTIDSFSFAILPSNIGFNGIRDMQTLAEVYNTSKKKYEFHGRVLYSASAMDESGFIQKDVICESFLGFLCDSQQRYVAERNWRVEELLAHIVTEHNSQVEPYKRFEIGVVTVTDPNDNLYLGIQRENSWQTIQDKLINTLGGEISFRVENGVNYLDYLERRGATLSTEIALSKNMKSITREDDPSAYISRLIPYGAKLKDAEGNDTEERLDITSVNNGLNYIESEEALQAFGIRYGVVEYDDVTTASALLQKAQAYLAENNKVQIKYTISALDLSLLGLDINDFEVCNSYPIKNALLGIDDVARIIKKTVDVVDESKSTFDVGDNFKTLSDIQLEREKAFAEATKKIQNVTTEIKGIVSNEVAKSSAQFEEIVVEQHTTIMNDFEQVIFNVLQAYTAISDFESYKEIVESQLQLLADQMVLKFSETTQHIEDINGTLQEQLNTVTKYFTFDIDGLTIGQVGNPNRVEIDNDRISILVNGVVVQSFDAQGQAIIPELTISGKLNLFGYVIEEDAQGNVNCAFGG